MDNQYCYTELEEGQIRLLQIQPDLDKGTLQCSLRKVPLKGAKNAFVALSWTWGKQLEGEAQQHVKIDGQLLDIRPNLWNMLNTFRKLKETSSLWIDAICINQDKNKPQEKNTQIPIMADIYKAAREVYIWLGESADDSDYVMETLRSNSHEAYTSSRFLTGLLQLLQRAWWTRTWILQEYVLNAKSPTVYCGHVPGVSAELILEVWTQDTTRIKISELIPEMSKLQGLGTIYWLHYLRDNHDKPHNVHHERSLWNALLWLKGFKVTEPRDKIYGALGLIKAEHREQFVKLVGVHTDRAAVEVYWDAAIYLLECEKNSTVFYDFPVGRHNGLDAPSWVPDFDLNTTSAVQSIIRLGNVTSAELSVERENVTISKDRRTMTGSGRILDRVGEMIVVGDETIPGSDLLDELATILRMPHLLHKILDLVSHNKELSSFKQPLSEPLWKTLVAGRYGSVKDKDLEDEIGCQHRFDELMTIPLCSLSKLPPLGISWNDFFLQLRSRLLEPDEVRDYYLAVLQSLKQQPKIVAKIRRTLSIGKTFFAGEKGYYGISEAGTQKGDLIVLLFPDHFIPFILRERGEAYEMVGVAYLPGPMRDVAISEIQRNRKLLIRFDIV